MKKITLLLSASMLLFSTFAIANEVTNNNQYDSTYQSYNSTMVELIAEHLLNVPPQADRTAQGTTTTFTNVSGCFIYSERLSGKISAKNASSTVYIKQETKFSFKTLSIKSHERSGDTGTKYSAIINLYGSTVDIKLNVYINPILLSSINNC